MKKIIKLNESDLHNLILESVEEVIRNGSGDEFKGFKLANEYPRYLYHSTWPDNRYIIQETGLFASEGYTGFWCEEDEPVGFPPMVFMSSEPGYYNFSSDIDVWMIDTINLDKNKMFIDPCDGMEGCFCYQGDIPAEFLKLYSKGNIHPAVLQRTYDNYKRTNKIY